MRFNNKDYINDKEKADLFGFIIGEIFKDNEDEKFDKNFKLKIETEVKNFLDDREQNRNVQIDPITTKNVKKIIQGLKSTLSSGEDKISNLMLKNLGENYYNVLAHLFNISIQKAEIPKRWKKGFVKMIPKKQAKKSFWSNWSFGQIGHF